MTSTLDPELVLDDDDGVIEPDVANPDDEPPHETRTSPADGRELVSLRPALASGLSTVAAALVIGGIFNSWAARLFGAAVAAGGTLLAAWVLRSRRPTFAQVAVPVIIGGGAFLSVLPGDSPGDIQRVVRDAVNAGRLLQIPIPFDPGWRPLLTIVLGLLGFGAAWVGAATKRPMLGVVLPVPLVALGAISQPTSQQVLAGVLGFLPVLAAFGVLFGGDVAGAGAGAGADESGTGGARLGREFELTRLLRGGAGMAALAVLLVVMGQADFLFPKPVFDPNDRPQKPKSVPLSEQRDRILVRVQAPPGFTGPWRTGVLDVYEDGAWKLPGTSAARLVDIPPDGKVTSDSNRAPAVDVTLTTDDLGSTAVLPIVPTASKVRFPNGKPDLRLDTRTGTLRVPSGRAPSGLTYTISLPNYPTAKELSVVAKVNGEPAVLAVPDAPLPIQRLLAQAPPGPWEKLDYLRHKLLDNVVAKGAGTPGDVSVDRVVDLLEGSKKGTPFEIVAAQALLARWAGVPSRIGFGYNGVNEENGVLTVRPRNAAQWLEVRFDGFGWLPLLDVPPRAQADLTNKDKDDDRILPSTDVAVQMYVPVEIANPRLLFERVRAVLLRLSPFAVVLLLVFLATPGVARAARRRRRERWGEALGPRGRIAVAYTELRDAATDLSVGDPFATPIEYLDLVEEDAEHRELAWLVTRALYGDMAWDVADADADMAEEMSSSLQRRLRQAQPLQVRAVAFLSRASIVRPFSDEVPSIVIPAPMRAARLALGRVARWPGRRLRRWGRRDRRVPAEEAAT